MAKRPVYIPSFESGLLVETTLVEFTWHPGMASSQKKKSVADLHKSARRNNICRQPLEVSSKSMEDLGRRLSAFNLTVNVANNGRSATVETAFQSSKVFQNGGPYTDLLHGTSLAAKKDERLKDSGELIGFEFLGLRWPLEPKTAFYDWLYLNSLRNNQTAIDELASFDAFTDIEFNPKKSINCQAYSVALFKALHGRGMLDYALQNKEVFLDLISEGPINNAEENTAIQRKLI